MLVRRLARPMLAAIFVSGGINALRNPAGHAPVAEPVAQPTARALPINLPADTEQLVRIDAAVKVGAGILLAANRVPRLAAIALAGSLVPTTLAGHRFWEERDAEKRAGQQVHFFKNLGLLGGLLLAAVDTEGKPSVRWRAGRGARHLSDASRSAVGDAADATRRGRDAVLDAIPIG